jgi:hypothetical protein
MPFVHRLWTNSASRFRADDGVGITLGRRARHRPDQVVAGRFVKKRHSLGAESLETAAPAHRPDMVSRVASSRSPHSSGAESLQTAALG